VFWWFEKGGQYTRCEVLEVPGGYELRIVDPSGEEQVEQFDSTTALASRQQSVEVQLRNAGWSGPHGWVL
jgi:hypothetical protein